MLRARTLRFVRATLATSTSSAVKLFIVIAIAFASAAAQVPKLVIDSTIHPITEERVARAIAHAESTNAEALLIELRTPGGLETSTRKIIESILASKVPVIVYVYPGGSRAASAGFFILQAADIAAMAPGTNTGAAHPVSIGGGKIDEVLAKKIENDSAALMRAVVAKRGRNVEAAESGVRESKSFTEAEALQLHLIDIVAKDERDLLQQLEGREIKRFNGEAATLRLAGKTTVPFESTLRQRILGWLMDPNVAFILLAVGMLALYAEFNHPGAILPGVVGLIFILLAVFALNILPTRFAAVALILAAFVLFALEVKLTSHGVLGAGGVVAMTLGALLLIDTHVPEMRVRLATALGVSIPLGVITVALLHIAWKARRNKVITGAEGLVGETGTARTALAPDGMVFVAGELWRATAVSPIAADEPVVVRSVDGLTLHVERR